MKQSEMLIPTQKQDPTGAEAISHKMLIRAGYIRQVSAGTYAYLPLAYRVLEKIEKIIQSEMNKTGANEMLLPDIIPASFWKDSGRYDSYGPELFKLKNRHDTDFILGPTHEETVTELIKGTVNSYKKLPLNIYQIQSKYRDEDRPRYGLLRSREFLMLDAYSFSANDGDLDEIYKKMRTTFENIFNQIGLNYRGIIGDSGSMGGSDSMEFSAPAAVGEDTIVYSDDSDYAANLEMATDMFVNKKSHGEINDLELVDTPDIKNIKQVAKFFDVDSKQIIKSLLYIVDEKPVLVLLRGDQEANIAKIKRFFNAENVELATLSQVENYLGVKPGSVGPFNINAEISIVADEYVKSVVNGVAGSNENDKHYNGVNPERDLQNVHYGDFRTVKEGDISPDGSGVLQFTKGIEIGHIFKLGTRYSKVLGADILDENGRQQPVIMGCYGIGISRLLSAVSEQQADSNGLVWPKAIAPFDVHIIPTNLKKESQSELAQKINDGLEKAGFQVLIDDRKERAGVKFADSDLIGIPIRITVGKKADEGIVEVKIRKTGETVETRVDDLKNTIHILSKEI
ncbi:proline--tRNA ligase [Fructilactobacillus lindneri]|uniref:Proline--tRNA ligase n=2 Tax=Fructilactobacillus lindneri TaxID=53444 RepID=A0A0R2JWM4_9LACO|nr:proline--tRNA ligase [Fructilactobacillus lindneri]ANZ58102.1 proline--tRNA ligase [Fructilactobacillus lindneri]ANZ59423.1 proline--tRNA ligase [Fructilactobacillus lindneri]KRN78919.1 prolyl-tRNA synthetase [Fructilactobacillus lindneri DSM 20690 = JCM 11027]POH03066.1 proline--tRNA ligase [Fructilactobacillus lindneri]POH04181.1 proline--tRNA ligase [Fructilactobacillus lindneri]